MFSTLLPRQHILLVEDDVYTLQLLAEVLDRDKYEITTASSANSAIQLLKERYFPVVISDMCLGAADGLCLLPYVKSSPHPSFIIYLTGQGSLETAMKAIQSGAFDYLAKPYNINELKEALETSIDHALQEVDLIESKEKKAPLAIAGAAPVLVGRTPEMVRIYRLIAKASLSEGNVLILGESGTGKELIARAIHDNSARSRGKFIAVNCSALTESLLESELFGHVKGSFTGAHTTKRGLLEEAEDGTLFLDEIGDLSPSIQVKLLRTIQEREVKAVGATESRKINVRIVTATHRNLKECIVQNTFREDLYYRLKVFVIKVPPLRERKDDILELTHFFIAQTNKSENKKIAGFSKDAMELLIQHDWPGNIRELKNTIERAVSMANTSVLFSQDLSEEILRSKTAIIEKTDENKSVLPFPTEEDLSLTKMEQKHIERVLEKFQYNKSEVAKQLGVNRVTLYRKAERYGIALDHTSPVSK